VPAVAGGGVRDRATFALPAIPAGQYRLRATPAPNGAPARLDVLVGHSGIPAWSIDFSSTTADDSQGTRAAEIRLPVGVSGLTLRAVGWTLDPASVVLEPLRVSPTMAVAGRMAHEAVAYDGLVAFFTGEDAYAEQAGFWVKPGVTATVVVVRPDAGGIAVRLRNAPIANHVSVRSGDLVEEWDLEEGAERELRLPARASGEPIVLRIRAERGIRPVERDPANRDMRVLAVWVALASDGSGPRPLAGPEAR
jgi:hypothetical protein